MNFINYYTTFKYLSEKKQQQKIFDAIIEKTLSSERFVKIFVYYYNNFFKNNIFEIIAKRNKQLGNFDFDKVIFSIIKLNVLEDILSNEKDEILAEDINVYGYAKSFYNIVKDANGIYLIRQNRIFVIERTTETTKNLYQEILRASILTHELQHYVDAIKGYLSKDFEIAERRAYSSQISFLLQSFQNKIINCSSNDVFEKDSSIILDCNFKAMEALTKSKKFSEDNKQISLIDIANFFCYTLAIRKMLTSSFDYDNSLLSFDSFVAFLTKNKKVIDEKAETEYNKLIQDASSISSLGVFDSKYDALETL